jgi:hypothetical protein
MQNYLSATYTNSTSFTSYDDVRLRMNNSLLLSAKNKYFGWQLNLGQIIEKAPCGLLFKKQENGMNSLLSKRMRIVQEK